MKNKLCHQYAFLYFLKILKDCNTAGVLGAMFRINFPKHPKTTITIIFAVPFLELHRLIFDFRPARSQHPPFWLDMLHLLNRIAFNKLQSFIIYWAFRSATIWKYEIQDSRMWKLESPPYGARDCLHVPFEQMHIFCVKIRTIKNTKILQSENMHTRQW